MFGLFDRKLAASPVAEGIRDGVREGLTAAVPSLVDMVLHALWEHPAYPVLTGAHLRLIEAGMKPVPAAAKARSVLQEFLRDERAKVGDPRFAWDAAAGRTLAEEYEIAHWEQKA